MGRTNLMNALFNCKNPHQGESKKVLCVCSAGLLRSPTAALVLSQEPFNFNTRACGLHDYALILIDEVLLTWADEVVVMSAEHAGTLLSMTEGKKKIVNLDIPDIYGYRDEKLMQMISERYTERGAK